jgi:hypothetical protein
MIKAHFIDIANDNMIHKLEVSVVPRLGDELRFKGETYYKVMLVVFVYDEGKERVNIGCDLVT